MANGVSTKLLTEQNRRKKKAGNEQNLVHDMKYINLQMKNKEQTKTNLLTRNMKIKTLKLKIRNNWKQPKN